MSDTEIDERSRINVLLTTSEYLITGELFLPVKGSVTNPTIENLLFHILNCGNTFIALRNCVITSKVNMEYQPECVDYYNINLNIVQTCQIVKE